MDRAEGALEQSLGQAASAGGAVPATQATAALDVGQIRLLGTDDDAPDFDEISDSDEDEGAAPEPLIVRDCTLLALLICVPRIELAF